MNQEDIESYKRAGVDIDAGARLVDKIKPLARATTRLGADTNLGGFGALFDLKAINFRDPILVSATDGVGTKLRIAIETGIHDTIGIDLVAMCVNDLIVQGAEPLFFLDYFATGKLDIEQAAQVIAGIATGCKQAGCALIGGETAEMPGMYQVDDYDLAGFAVGVVERENLLPMRNIYPGDIVIGLSSSGVHSNGFSLVRHILHKKGVKLTDKTPFDQNLSFAETLLVPTKIYVKSCLAAIKASKVKALAHITGGGLLENIPRILPSHLSVELDHAAIEIKDIFQWLATEGNIPLSEMMRTFNCGIGMVLITSADDFQDICDVLTANGEKARVIGRVVAKITHG
jgi:phosphoribosylaminoimidazole synthetase